MAPSSYSPTLLFPSFSTLFFLSLHFCIMDIPFLFSIEDPEIDFSLSLQDSEHVEDDLFSGLGEVPLHVEEDPSGVEQWLEEGEVGATAPVSQPREREEERASIEQGVDEDASRHVSGGAVPCLVINLVGVEARDVPNFGALKSDLDVQGASGEGG